MSEMLPFLFTADLDGTLLPNTSRVAEPGCIERTRRLLAELMAAGCPVCFVSGRHLALAREGQRQFGLPEPAWWVCSLGTEIHHPAGVGDLEWRRHLGPRFDPAALREALRPIPRLSPQESSKQGAHKFSLYYPEPAPWDLRAEILERAGAVREGLQLIASVEEGSGRALLDLVPSGAGKARAVWYLAGRYGLAGQRIFFAGDSGNDFDALFSGLNGVLVGNAPEPVRAEARRLQEHFPETRLYLAAAPYGDGVAEGLRHYGLWDRNGAQGRPPGGEARRHTNFG